MELEMLIDLVRVHPALYDTSHVDYTRSKLKDELWEKIGAELETDGASAKEQWRKLRENHREAMRRQKMRKSKDGAERRKPWIYQSQMDFLLPFMKSRLTQSNSLDPLCCSTPPEDDEDVDGTAGAGEIPPPSSNEEHRSGPTENEIPRKKAKNQKGQSSQQFVPSSGRIALDVRQQALEKQQPDHQNEALYQFFLSMYNTTKGLPARYQRQVRNKVYEAVVHAEELYELETSRDDSILVSHGFPCSSANATHPSTNPS